MVGSPVKRKDLGSYQKFDGPKTEAKETVRFFTVISHYLLFRLYKDKDTTIRDTATDNGDDVTSSTVLGVDKEVATDLSGQEASNSQRTGTMDLEVYKTATDVPLENCGNSESTYSGLDDSSVNTSDTIDEVLFSNSVAGDNSSFTLQYGTLGNTSHSESFSESSDDTITASSNCESDSEFYPSPAKKLCVTPVNMGKSIFVCEIAQLQQLIDQVNLTSNCYTPRCTGKLVPVNVKLVGLGGAAIVKFACTGCTDRNLAFHSSVTIALSKRTVVSLALQVAFVIAGCTHAQYSKVLKQCMGVSSVSASIFYDTIKLIHPVVHNMLSEMCDEAKSEMRSLGPAVVGSWKRAVTTSDGVWLTRGKFSQNCSFTVRNYMNNALLYYVHVCMRGKMNDIVGGELYRGTAKGAEGYAANIAFQKAKHEGIHIEVQWQDGDSSAAKSFREHFPDETKSRIMLCGGHVARSFTKSLGELAKQKSFSATKQDHHKKAFPNVDTVKCCCPKRHSKNCGCLSKSFIKGARTNFFYCLLHGDATKDPKAFASRLTILGKYHARDIHSWHDGKCDFHSDVSCTCGNCEDDQVNCDGQEYHTKSPLTCPFHALAFEIECESRASQAKHIIHPELGRGHSNYPEASHNVLIRFRSKDKNLQRVHYIVSTNLGLLQANMSWLGEKRGLSYHWILDLFSRLKLPVFDSMAEELKKANEIRAKNLSKKKTNDAKEKRTKWKKARAQEQQERKIWSRRQHIEHTYGSEENSSEEEDTPPKTSTSTQQKRSKKCKCGSSEHKTTRHHNCPLNKQKQNLDDGADNKDDDSNDKEQDSKNGVACTCGSNRASHHRACPLNPRNH